MAELKDYIDQSGLKVSYIADKLFLSRFGLYSKMIGRCRWKDTEVEKLRDLLRIPEDKVSDIFLNVKYTK